MANNGQLDKFGDALFDHPFRNGVFSPSQTRSARNPAEFLKEFAEHYAECNSGLCVGYHTAFLISYFSHLSHDGLSELVAALKQLNINSFLQRVQFFIERESRNGCAPKKIFLKKLTEPDVIIRDMVGSHEEVVRGRMLAQSTQASKVYIRGFTSMGEMFVIPGIAPKTNTDYLPVKLVAEILIYQRGKKLGSNLSA